MMTLQALLTWECLMSWGVGDSLLIAMLRYAGMAATAPSGSTSCWAVADL